MTRSCSPSATRKRNSPRQPRDADGDLARVVAGDRGHAVAHHHPIDDAIVDEPALAPRLDHEIGVLGDRAALRAVVVDAREHVDVDVAVVERRDRACRRANGRAASDRSRRPAYRSRRTRIRARRRRSRRRTSRIRAPRWRACRRFRRAASRNGAAVRSANGVGSTRTAGFRRSASASAGACRGRCRRPYSPP